MVNSNPGSYTSDRETASEVGHKGGQRLLPAFVLNNLKGESP